MKKILIILVLVLIVPLLWWTLSPLFIDVKVQDQLDPEIEARLRMQEEVDQRRAASAAANGTTMSETTAEETDPTPRPAAGTGTYVQGPFAITGTTGHPASGQLEVIHSQGEKLLRFNEYDGTNGPDLHVYLATDLDATDYLDLGPAKGNQGTLIYGMPLDVDLTEYKYVLTWCKAFGVLFDYAEIQL